MTNARTLPLALALTFLGGGFAARDLGQSSFLTVDGVEHGTEFVMISTSSETHGGPFRTPTTLEVEDSEMSALFVAIDDQASINLRFSGPDGSFDGFSVGEREESSLVGLTLNSGEVPWLYVQTGATGLAEAVGKMPAPLYVHFGQGLVCAEPEVLLEVVLGRIDEAHTVCEELQI